MLVLKRMKINRKLTQLQCTFPKLTEANQQYVLGLAEGLKRAQKGSSTNNQKEVRAGFGKMVKKSSHEGF
jgi:hypothetical protein